ncbi:hypothetical protein GCM10010129_71020 [Streptomyces fumigatiscleroticus]|nr:hypothetical protein GCM10010129_71020 [Streptomyces fumigatiscleroticus]
MSGGIRAPKQERSQRSFESVLDTTLELLAEKGYAGFALTEVSRRSGVSVGSICTRVDGKDDLLRAAQSRFQERMLEEHRALTEPGRWTGVPLAELLPRLIADFAALLERQGRILGAFLQRGAIDPEVAKVGKAAYFDLHDRFVALLLSRREEIRHPDPVRAVGSCFTTVYPALARGLALDVPAEARTATRGSAEPAPSRQHRDGPDAARGTGAARSTPGLPAKGRETYGVLPTAASVRKRRGFRRPGRREPVRRSGRRTRAPGGREGAAGPRRLRRRTPAGPHVILVGRSAEDITDVLTHRP